MVTEVSNQPPATGTTPAPTSRPFLAEEKPGGRDGSAAGSAARSSGQRRRGSRPADQSTGGYQPHRCASSSGTGVGHRSHRRDRDDTDPVGRCPAPDPVGPGRARAWPGPSSPVTSSSKGTSTPCCGSCTTPHPAISGRMGLRSLPAVVDAARRLGALGPPLPAAARGVPTGRPAPLAVPGRRGDQPPLRRGQRLLPARPRPEHDLFVRPVRDRRRLPRGRAGGQARTDLPQAGSRQRPGARLLDVGCGWGSMAIHAARHHGATVVGVALSREQVDEAAAPGGPRPGWTEQVEIRLQDYRDLRGEQFDAISSIGMFEHVGSRPDGPVLRDPARYCWRRPGAC